jgi:hypothetical protein
MPVAVPRPKPKPVFSRADILPEFEVVLLASYVYRKNVANEENLSFRSSMGNFDAWSWLDWTDLDYLNAHAVRGLRSQEQES